MSSSANDSWLKTIGAESSSKKVRIAAFDRSGSTVSTKYLGHETIFDAQVRVVFNDTTDVIPWLWSTAKPKYGNLFGILDAKIPIGGAKAATFMNMMCAKFEDSGTQSWTPFEYLLNDQHLAIASSSTPFEFIFVTDGDMDARIHSTNESGPARFASIIKQCKIKYPNMSIRIITVSSKDVDFTNISETNAAVGSDVWKCISSNNLTGMVSQFISYTPKKNPNGFNQITFNPVCPQGFYQYGEKYFHPNDIKRFDDFIRSEIKVMNFDQMCDVITKLSKTICDVTAGNPGLLNGIVKKYVSMFINADIPADEGMINYLLTTYIDSDRTGQAMRVADFKATRTNLFKSVNIMLENNAQNACNVHNGFSLPIKTENSFIIITAPSGLMTASFASFAKAAVPIDGSIVPILPSNIVTSGMSQQAIRQYARLMMSKHVNNPNVNGNDIIIEILYTILLVVKSTVSDELKDAYRRIGIIMLKKTRPNVDVLEIDYLSKGGYNADFINEAGKIANKYQINITPKEMWWCLLTGLDNEGLINGQNAHYTKASLDQIPTINVQVKSFSHYSDYAYTCLITQESTETNGGFVIKNHNNCEPKCVFSHDGMNGLLSSSMHCCPYCYNDISREMFVAVPPKSSENIILPEDYKNKMKNISVPIVQPVPNVSVQRLQSTSGAGSSVPQPSRPQTAPNNQKNIMIVHRGTVGAGKSTTTNALIAEIAARGGVSHVVSMDDVRRTNPGLSNHSFLASIVTNLLNTFLRNTIGAPTRYVIVDTCGEQFSQTNLFGVNMSAWEVVYSYPGINTANPQLPPNDWMRAKEWEGYIKYSLLNVLNRNAPSSVNTIYALNPVEAGLEICLKVHRDKFTSLFGGIAYKDRVGKLPKTIDEIKTYLEPVATEYRNTLKSVSEVAKDILGSP